MKPFRGGYSAALSLAIYTQTLAEKYCFSLISHSKGDFKHISHYYTNIILCHWQNILYLQVFLSQNINIDTFIMWRMYETLIGTNRCQKNKSQF